MLQDRLLHSLLLSLKQRVLLLLQVSPVFVSLHRWLGMDLLF